MKTVKITLDLECTDSTCISDLVSDLKDGLLCDNVKKGIIEYEENGTILRIQTSRKSIC
mgnify:FL=1